MNTRTITASFAAALLSLAGIAFAAEPATQPAGDVKQLINQLGSDEFKLREEATDKLVKMGQESVPALKQATKSEDPEVKARAETALRRIETGDKPEIVAEPVAPAQQPFQIGGQQLIIGGAGRQMSVRIMNGAKTIDAKEDNKKVHIEETPDGITMSVTEPKDGKDVTTEYKAKNADELKTNQPEAFAIYQKYGGQGNGLNAVGAGNFQIQIGGAVGNVQIGGDPNVQGIAKHLQDVMNDHMQRLQQLEDNLNGNGQLNGVIQGQLQLQQQRRQQMQPLQVQPIPPVIINPQPQNQDNDAAKKIIEQLQQINPDVGDQPKEQPATDKAPEKK